LAILVTIYLQNRPLSEIFSSPTRLSVDIESDLRLIREWRTHP